MKKIIAFCAICAVCVSNISALSAGSAALYDCAAESFLFEQSADEPRLFASTTKIMTALLALELYDIDEEIVVKPEWCGIEGSSIYLVPNEKITVEALVYGLLLVSGNDAAVALASLDTGSVADFVTAMNERATQIGAKNTHFENPNGLDGAEHKTTAKDLALITACALKNEMFKKIVATESIKIGDRYFTNHNKLLKMSGEIIGVKTGFTKAAGRCLVSAIDRGGRVFVSVTLNAPDDWNDHLYMYKTYAPQVKSSVIVGEDMFVIVPVAGTGSTVNARTQSDITLALSEEEKQNKKIYATGARLAYAPIKKGDVYGEICVELGGKIMAKQTLYYDSDVWADGNEKSWIAKIWERICGEQ